MSSSKYIQVGSSFMKWIHTQFALSFFMMSLGAVKGAPLHLNEEGVEMILRLLDLVFQLFHIVYKIKVTKLLI